MQRLALLLTLLLISSTADCSKRYGVSFKDNSYTLLVGIDEEISRVYVGKKRIRGCSAQYDLLVKLKDFFAKASRLMFTATKQHAHIGEVRFLLPERWLLDHVPGSITCSSGVGEMVSFHQQRIQILSSN